MGKYLIDYNSHITNDYLDVEFQRLHEDVRDQMSDDPRPQWEPKDDFVVTLSEHETKVETIQHNTEGTIWTSKRTHVKHLRSMELAVRDKDSANLIWYLCAKEGHDFSDILNLVQDGRLRSTEIVSLKDNRNR